MAKMQRPETDWEQVAIEQSEIIAGLSNLCSRCIKELAQYRAIDAEEQRLKDLSDNESE